MWRIGQRAYFEPERALITGAGPVGLLAAMLSVQRGLDTHVLDRVTEGPKPGIVAALGATYHHDDIDTVAARLQPDVVIEATGAGPVVFGAIANTSTYGIVCLTGVSPAGGGCRSMQGRSIARWCWRTTPSWGRSTPTCGTIVRLLTRWPRRPRLVGRLITRRVPIHRAPDAFDAQPGDVKVVIALDE